MDHGIDTTLAGVVLRAYENGLLDGYGAGNWSYVRRQHGNS
jgi:hypothetical protein